MRPSIVHWTLALAGLTAVLPATGFAASPSHVDLRAYQKAVDAAVEFLGKAQAPDGTYADDTVEPGMTAVVTTGLLRAGRGVNEPLVAKGLKYIAAQVKPDGGIHGAGTHFQNYETCLSVLCLSEGNRDGRYNRILKAAEQFIKKDQWGADESVNKTNLNYGDDCLLSPMGPPKSIRWSASSRTKGSGLTSSGCFRYPRDAFGCRPSNATRMAYIRSNRCAASFFSAQ